MALLRSYFFEPLIKLIFFDLINIKFLFNFLKELVGLISGQKGFFVLENFPEFIYIFQELRRNIALRF
jgi:hypothetical protein